MRKQKAWELELDVLKKGMPVILSEEEQTWDFSFKIEEVMNTSIAQRWESHVPGSGAEEHVIIAAMQAMHNMGYDVSEAEQLMDEGLAAYAAGDCGRMAALYSKVLYRLSGAPKDESHPYWRYTVYHSYEQYRQAVSFTKYDYDMDSEEYLRRTHLGWLAQICAGAVGTAIEGYCTDNIRKVFGEIYDYPRTPNTFNDDITYELAFLKALEKCGRDMTSCDIAEQWVELIPTGWTAEDIALKNLQLGIFPPQSGYLNNPYREWIGAQMRGAVCGMIAPGDPERAARYAYMDAVVSHHNNGVMGEIFNAVLVSLSYVKSNMREMVTEAAAAIPQDCEYYAVIQYALDVCRSSSDWESAWRQCEERFKTYNWIHAYPNAAAEIIALWFGSSFDEMIHIIAMEGYDVDCNAAQIATAYAIWEGKPLDERWSAPIGDKLETYMRGIRELSICELSQYTCALARANKE